MPTTTASQPSERTLVRRHVNGLVAEHARLIARRFGVPAPMLSEALRRTVQPPIAWGPPYKHYSAWTFDDLSFQPSPLQALRVMQPRRAIALFAGEGLDMLTRRLAVLEHLRNPNTPLYEPDRLKTLTLTLRDFLQHNVQHVVETGYPSGTFTDSAWHGYWLTTLYPTREPEPPFFSRAAGRQAGRAQRPVHAVSPGCRCRWCTSPQLRLLSDFSTNVHHGVLYESFRKVESERLKLMGVRLQMIEAMAGAFDGGADLLARCLELVCTCLRPADVAFYFSLDRQSYLGFDLRTGEAIADEQPGPPGAGLTMTVMAAAFHDAELVWGAYGRTRRELDRLIDVEQFRRAPGSAPPDAAYAAYLDAAGRGQKRQMDAVLDQFLVRNAQHVAHIHGFSTRFLRGLEERMADGARVRAESLAPLFAAFEDQLFQKVQTLLASRPAVAPAAAAMTGSAPRRRRTRMSPEEINRTVVTAFKEDPDATRDTISAKTGLATGTISNTPAWKFMSKLKKGVTDGKRPTGQRIGFDVALDHAKALPSSPSGESDDEQDDRLDREFNERRVHQGRPPTKGARPGMSPS